MDVDWKVVDINGCYQYVANTSMASLTKKPHSKYWFACFRDLNGRQCRRSTGETSEKKAREIARHYELVAQKKLKPHKARETLSELYRQVYGETLPAASVRQFIKDWLAIKENETSPATYATYQKSTAKFLTFLGTDAERDIAEIRQTHVSSFRNSLAKKVAPGTANFDLKCIRMLFRAARRDGYIVEDPAEFVRSVKRDNGSGRRPFRVEEIQTLLSIADSEWQSLIKFGLYTGQRLSDIASLNWSNLDTEKNQIRLVTRKTGKTMLLPIAAPLRSHISSLKGSDDPKAPVHPKAFATLQRQGRAGGLSNQFADLLADAGLREASDHSGKDKGRNTKRAKNELSFHCLRHTAVTLLKDAGIPEAVVMELVGHDSKQMSAHYTHVGQEALEKAAAALPEV
jgi:integrase